MAQATDDVGADEDAPSVFIEDPDAPPEYTDADRKEIALTQRPHLFDTLGVRVGVGLHGLAGSQQGRPLIYPDISLRYKTGSLYLDVRAPALIAGLDFGQFLLRSQVLGLNASFRTLFETMNKPPQYAQAEVGMLRIGQLWNRRIGAKDGKGGVPVQLSAGLAAVADWVIFETRLLSEPIPEDASIGDFILTDPIVLGAGLFGSIGQRRENFHVDLSLMIARDMFQWDNYGPLSGFLISPDVEVIILFNDNFGIALRNRITLYTHVKNPRPYSIQSDLGVIVSF